MARRTFFSFHYDRDIWRASIVRNSWLTKDDREDAGFWDASLWEEAKKKGDDAIKNMIDEALKGTSVTAVLIGKETSGRDWVRYEVQASHDKGNGLLGIFIHNIKDNDGNTDSAGDTDFGPIGEDDDGNPVYFSDLYLTYDWVDDDGYNNLGEWVEHAAQAAGKAAIAKAAAEEQRVAALRKVATGNSAPLRPWLSSG